MLTKRLIDVPAALLGLLLTAPLTVPLTLLLTAYLALPATAASGAPLVGAERVGRDGRVFRLLALRTEGVPGGRLLRRSRLDRLPRLLNVLGGQLSLVGPRPLAPAASGYTGRARHRLLVPPGLTGLWHVAGAPALTWGEMVELDLYYVARHSARLDLAILLRLPRLVRLSGPERLELIGAGRRSAEAEDGLPAEAAEARAATAGDAGGLAPEVPHVRRVRQVENAPL